MNQNLTEVVEMTDNQFETMRNDLIDLVIDKAKLILTNEEELARLIEEYSKLKR